MIPCHAKGVHDLTSLLTDAERKTVSKMSDTYRERFGSEPETNPNLCFFLGDSASYCTWSAASNKLPTFRRMNHGLYWFPHHRRWMMAVDKLAALGFPTSKPYADAMCVMPVPIRDAKRSSTLSGNCMHLANVALIELVGLVCFGKRS